MSTTGGSDIEHSKYTGQTSTIMRAVTSKDGDILSHFDESDDSQAQLGNTSLKPLLINNHKVVVKKGKFKGHLPLEQIFGLILQNVFKITNN